MIKLFLGNNNFVKCFIKKIWKLASVSSMAHSSPLQPTTRMVALELPDQPKL